MFQIDKKMLISMERKNMNDEENYIYSLYFFYPDILALNKTMYFIIFWNNCSS